MGQSVAWCRKNISVREFNCWIHRINEERQQEIKEATEPDKSDYYSMQIAAEVRMLRYTMSGKRKEVHLKDFILRSKEQEETEAKDSIEKQTKLAQSAVVSRLQASGANVAMPDFTKWQQQLMKS